MLGLQFRTHLFSFVVFGKYARILRWDASGILVTERFDYHATHGLADFFRRFDAASKSDRGHDPTTLRLDSDWPKDLVPPAILHHLRDANDYEHDDVSSATRRVRRHRHFAIIKIPDRKNPTHEGDFLISSPPMHQWRSPLGRFTRPMLAYDLRHRALVFVKQYWRVVEPNSRKEGDVYSLLEDKGVRHLPQFGMGNDVRGICSKTQSSECAQRSTQVFPTFRLHRVSLNTVGEPLSQFRTTEELVRVVTDAMTCHDDACFKANILHCDVSVGNIMIDPTTRRGMLIDWDSCAELKPGSTETCDPDQTGTWEFLSVSLLMKPKVPHSIMDDRESALYVLVWVLLHYGRYECPFAVGPLLVMFRQRGKWQQGCGKHSFLLARDFDQTMTLDGCQTLAALITTLQLSFFERYIPDFIYTQEQHDKVVATLSEEGWLVRLMEKVLKDGPWSPSDGSTQNNLPGNPDRKRRAYQAGLEDEERFSKSRKLSHYDYVGTRSLPRDLDKLPPPKRFWIPSPRNS